MKSSTTKAGQGRRLLAMGAFCLLMAGTLIAGSGGAAYGAIAQYEIAALSSNSAYGTVSGGGLYTTEQSATLTATPKAGYRFVDWKEGDPAAAVSTDAVYTFPVTASRTLTAWMRRKS